MKQTENFEAQLFKTADKLRKNIDAAEYKHIVLGLVFISNICSDSFENFLLDKLKEKIWRRLLSKTSKQKTFFGFQQKALEYPSLSLWLDLPDQACTNCRNGYIEAR